MYLLRALQPWPSEGLAGWSCNQGADTSADTRGWASMIKCYASPYAWPAASATSSTTATVLIMTACSNATV